MLDDIVEKGGVTRRSFIGVILAVLFFNKMRLKPLKNLLKLEKLV